MSINTPSVTVLPDGRMDRKNAATYVGLSVKTLAMYASSGQGPAFIKRGRTWYRRDVLDAWLEGGRATSSAMARSITSIAVSK